MRPQEIREIKKKIRTLIYHLGALQGSYPKVLEDPDYARAHLLILRQVIPYLMHLLCFAAETVPLIERVIQVASRGDESLGHVSQNLRHIDSQAESAVQQVMTELEQIENYLSRAREAADSPGEVKAAVEAASERLTEIFSALQFQDITSQKIEATQALLAQLDRGLRSLVEQLGLSVGRAEIEVREGTFDERAEFDREKARESQRRVDRILKTETQRAQAFAEEESDIAEEATRDQTVTQEDIDAWLEEKE